MSRLWKLVLAGFLACSAAGPVQADPLQDELNRIAEDMMQLSIAAINGEIDDDVAAKQMEDLLERDTKLRTGGLTLDALTLRWQDQGDQPLKAPGARLRAVGLPPGFDSAVWGVLSDGRRIDVLAEAPVDDPYSVDIYVPDHPDGADATDNLTIQFEGAGSLRITIAPRLFIPDALPLLMRLAIDDLVASLERDSINPEALVRQIRQDPENLPPELGYAAAALYIWSEAGRGHPVFGFLRTGRLDGEFWDSQGASGNADDLNRIFSSALQNSQALDRLMRLQAERIDKIIFVPSASAANTLVHKAKTDHGYAAPPPESVSMHVLSDLLLEGRARQYNRRVFLESAKNAQKVYGYASFEPITMTSAALAGGVLTMIDKYTKIEDYNYPVTMSLEGSAIPGDPLLADDKRKVFPDLTVVAKGEPYEIKVFGDGLDVLLGAVDIAASTTAIGKGLKTLGQPAQVLSEAERARQLFKASMDNTEDFLLKQSSSLTKDGLEEVEKRGDKNQKGSFDIITVPARTWRAKVDQRTYRDYLSVGYRGEVAWDVRQYHALACWKDTQEGIAGTVTTKSDAFAGLFDRLDLGWTVQDPQITLTVEPSVIRPGQTAKVTASTSGAQQTHVDFGAPPLGALSDIGDVDATYGAPAEIAACQEFVPISATYPSTGARICAPPPKAISGVVIAKGDALVRTPSTLTCRDGEVLGFTVAHPDDAPVMCRLDGPGVLTMVGNEGLLDCPVKPRRDSSITCYTGQSPGTCAPVIPIRRIYPDFAVYAQVSADRRYSDALNDNVDGFFDVCGIENPTALMLELMDLGTGAADTLAVEQVRNDCPTLASVSSGGGGVSGSGGGSPSSVEGKAEGGYVARWPMGEGRDVSVADSHSYSHRPYDPGRGPGDRSVFVVSDVSASLTLDGPERFVVLTDGKTTATSIRDASEIPTPSGGFAEWSIWRRIVVTRDVAVTTTISTGGPARSLVQAAPMRLEDNVPVMLLFGFDQNRTPVMMVGQTDGFGLGVPQSDTSTVVLPGPRDDRDSLTYLIRFGGRITPAEVADNEVSAASQTTVTFDIRPVQ